jgi:hypothetical protein
MSVRLFIKKFHILIIINTTLETEKQEGDGIKRKEEGEKIDAEKVSG